MPRIKPMYPTPAFLPDDVWDTFHLIALENGGVGHGRFRVDMPGETQRRPCCIYGFASDVDIDMGSYGGHAQSAEWALVRAGIKTIGQDRANDAVVRTLCGLPAFYGGEHTTAEVADKQRVEWLDYCTAMNLWPERARPDFGL
jgi:hypothetical protein